MASLFCFSYAFKIEQNCVLYDSFILELFPYGNVN